MFEVEGGSEDQFDSSGREGISVRFARGYCWDSSRSCTKVKVGDKSNSWSGRACSYVTRNKQMKIGYRINLWYRVERYICIFPLIAWN